MGTPLHVRGRGLPDGEPVEWWIAEGVLSAEPVAGAETVFDGGWILPGLVDAHCHVGLGAHGPVELDEAAAQAETERDAGALLLRDAGSPTDTRSFDDRADLPRIIRAGRHLARPKRYTRGFAAELDDPWELPDAVAEQARWGDGWVKLVGDWIDRDTGDLAPLWSDDVLVAAIDAAHANGARVTAHVFSEDALPGLIKAGIDCIEHGTGLTEDTIDLMVEHGTALVPTLINIENFPGIAERCAPLPGLPEAHACAVRNLFGPNRCRARGGRAHLCGHRRGQRGGPRPHRGRGRCAQGHRHVADRRAGRGVLERPGVATPTRSVPRRTRGSGVPHRGSAFWRRSAVRSGAGDPSRGRLLVG